METAVEMLHQLEDTRFLFDAEHYSSIWNKTVLS